MGVSKYQLFLYARGNPSVHPFHVCTCLKPRRGNSLKAEVVRCDPAQKSASEASKLIDIMVEDIGKQGKLSRFRDKQIDHSEPVETHDYVSAAANMLRWLEGCEEVPRLDAVDFVGVRVVHGGHRFTRRQR